MINMNNEQIEEIYYLLIRIENMLENYQLRTIHNEITNAKEILAKEIKKDDENEHRKTNNHLE